MSKLVGSGYNSWPAPEGTYCCEIDCDRKAEFEWEDEFVTRYGEGYWAATQGCYLHTPEELGGGWKIKLPPSPAEEAIAHKIITPDRDIKRVTFE